MKKVAKFCATKHCRNKRSGASKKCSKCNQRIYRERNPMKAAFQNLKSNAKRRGKEFSLTFEQFEEFCVKCEYLKGKGITAQSLHIDRIDESKGYSMDNIQVLSNSENVKKYLQMSFDQRNKPVFITETKRKHQDEEGPF